MAAANEQIKTLQIDERNNMSSKPLIYLASPYSHPDPSVRQERYEAACKAAASLMRQGHHIYSPIAATHPLAAAHDLPGDWQYWQCFDCNMINRCDEVFVLMLDGWQDSVGVQAEIQYATTCGKPVEYIPPHPDQDKVQLYKWEGSTNE